MKELLNPYQKQSLQIALQMFEENLRRLQEVLQGKYTSGILYRHRMDCSPEKKAALERMAQDGLNEVAELAARFDLPVNEVDPLKSLNGVMSVSWTNLIDAGSDRLIRYGEVDGRLSNELDPAINQLAGLALEIARLLE